MRIRGGLWALAAVGAIGCGSDDPEVGFVGAVCYPNATCNSGLVCRDGLCVAGGMASASPGTIFDDGGARLVGGDGGTGASGGSGGQATGGAPPGVTGGFGGLLVIDDPGGSPSADANAGCLAVSYAAEGLPFDLYLMVDRSSSMQESLPGSMVSKWDAVVQAIGAGVSSTVAATRGTRFALQYFGLPDACNVASYATPEVPLGLPAEVADTIAQSLATTTPNTLTPTASALEGALQYSSAQASPGRQAAVVLVTDGFPTQCGVSCSTSADCFEGTCESGICSPNSVREIEALAARYAGMTPAVLTFVVGLAEGFANIHAIARGGGTGEAHLIDSGDIASQVEQALQSVISSPLSCQYHLPETEDPQWLNVVVRDSAGSTEVIPRVTGSSQCATAGQGWYYSDPTAVTPSIVLCSQTCANLGMRTVELQFGCATLHAEP